ncbi:DUF2181 domain-containing protein [Tamlana sp. 2201CG12-4]|nr:DUF2181 domain-containing protein [Tamlana sp. 2201CG12-4]
MSVFRYLFPSKVWAHRVNSIEKYQEAQNVFSGVELDLVFSSSSNNFDVNHPPAKSIDLTLFDFFKSKKNYNDFGVWLDFKNLNESNFRQSAKKLDSIVSVLNINFENIVVESTNPLFLDEFSKKGFKTSYYLPSNISRFKNDDLIIQYKIINSTSINFISSNVENYAFMKENFPNTKILTWIINNPPKIKSFYTLKYSISNFKRNFIVLNDEDIEIVLFKFNAKSGNR